MQLDLTRIEIKPFSTDTVVNQFRCGKTSIDRFLKNKAKKTAQRCELRTFCAHLENSPLCIGYYALQIGSDSVADLPGAKETYLRNYSAFPAVHLAFLGVQDDYQRQGLGQYLLMDVFSRAAEIASAAVRKFAPMFAAHAVANFRTKSCTRINSLLVLLIRRKSRSALATNGTELPAGSTRHAGFYALTLQSLDDESTSFYKSLNFAIYSENLRQPKMLYPLADILILVRE
jgi:hypothetical protein